MNLNGLGRRLISRNYSAYCGGALREAQALCWVFSKAKTQRTA